MVMVPLFDVEIINSVEKVPWAIINYVRMVRLAIDDGKMELLEAVVVPLVMVEASQLLAVDFV